MLYLIYIYTTTRFTSFAKVKVIVKAEVTIACVCHLFAYCDAKVSHFCLSAKKNTKFFSFRQKKVPVNYWKDRF